MLLNNQQITEEIKKRNQNMHRNKWKLKHNNPKCMGLSKNSAKGKVHSNTSLPQETREKSNKSSKPGSIPKATRKKRNDEPQG